MALEGPIWLVWGIVALLAGLSLLLLSGRGSFLIAGYNTADAARKARYDEKRLCRVVGAGIGVIALMTGLAAAVQFDTTRLWLRVLFPWGIFGVFALMLVLAHTVCKKR